MGNYTEFCLGFELKTDLPMEISQVLEYMALRDAPIPETIPNHEFFETDRWGWMLQSGGSYYFSSKPVLKFIYDDISKSYYLTVWTNIKNYTNEIELFLEWIKDYVDVRQSPHYLGFTRYESCTHPTLIYLDNGKIISKHIDGLFSENEENWFN